MSTRAEKIRAGEGRVQGADASISEYIADESVTTAIAELFYPLFRRLVEDRDTIQDLEDDLAEANINIPAEIYGSALLGYAIFISVGLSLLAGVFSGVLVSLFGLVPDITAANAAYSKYAIVMWLIQAINVISDAFTAIILALAVGGLAGGAVIFLGVQYPQHIASRRERYINFILPEVVGFMYSLSVGGTNQIEMLEQVANAKDTYGEGSVEFQRIIHEMKYFNTDYQTAVQHVASMTPSDEMDAFLSDMLSIIESGGDMTTFLDTQQDMLQERSRKKQEEMLDTLEVFGEMYLSLNVLPMALLIVFVIVSLMGSPMMSGMYATTYAILPGINLMFGLLISTVKKDELSDGMLDHEGNIAALGEDETKLLDMGVIDYYAAGEFADFFRPVRLRELQYRLTNILRDPFKYFKVNPSYTLGLSIPSAAVTMMLFLATGIATTSVQGFVSAPFVQTFVWLYVPIFIILVPYAIFYEWHQRTIGKVTDTLTKNLRKLANANETGQPLLEAIRITSKGGDSVFEEELEQMYKKTKFGTGLSAAIVEFNNRYSIPRLSRSMKLIQKAQEASSNITPVLKTAAESSRYEDEIQDDRVSRTRVQVFVTAITFLVFLGVILMLEVFFIQKMIGAVSGESMPMGGFQSLDPNLISMVFFHAVTVQALSAGTISGYIQSGNLRSSMKYIIVFMLITVVAWGLGA